MGLFILILQWLATGIWTSLEHTLIVALDTTNTALGTVSEGLEHASSTFPTPYIPTH